ncbi:AAA family ATPase [Sphingobacterium siyangense]|uniref:AAA family ATPase n=1 Tax=Sphingobacterium siyangense TaxID=459529 RepID=UPI003DA1CBF7
MKIKRIEINNFKVFRTITFDFELSDLIVFDGPNGFGKTSIYDAIELLFTGRIRRFYDLKSKLVDGRESFSEHPFLCDYGDGDISIKIEFLIENSTYILERIAERTKLRNSIDFNLYKLYKKDDFHSENKILIEDEEEYLSEILGAKYKENFQFLNYIEQEDSLYLLKNQDKSRKQHISHLFNVLEFETKIEKILILKSKISELCNTEKRQEIDSLKDSIEKVEAFLANEFNNAEYIKLFPNNEIIWDIKDFDYKSLTYENIFGDEGIITRLKQVVNNKESFKNYIKNERISRLITDRKRTEEFLLHYNFISEKEQLLNQKDELVRIKKTLTDLKEFSIESFRDDNYKIDLKDYDFVNNNVIDNFNSNFDNLANKFKDLDSLESIYSKIKESREKLVTNIKNLHENQKNEITGACFLCGFEWNDIYDLLENIEIQSKNLEEMTSEKNKSFDEDLNRFKQETIAFIIDLLDERASYINVDVEFVNRLLSIDEAFFHTVKSDFDSIGFDYIDHLNLVLSSESEVDLEKVISLLDILKVEAAKTTIQSYFKDYFSKYFHNNFELLENLELETIIKKEDYLKYKYSILQNESLEKDKQTMINKETIFNNAKVLETQLKNLHTIYKKSLKDFQNKVIKDIEIIFHIYSGRIMQYFQGGLGLFIFHKDGIRFQTNPTKTFDAVFSMSSGQLSALIMSFTLALHKKYSQNKIILIDDPVQTMDEINIAGFIELLRNEFHSNQIIISTHEDMASAYMRYKFKNYGLMQKRINLKSYSVSQNG